MFAVAGPSRPWSHRMSGIKVRPSDPLSGTRLLARADVHGLERERRVLFRHAARQEGDARHGRRHGRCDRQRTVRTATSVMSHFTEADSPERTMFGLRSVPSSNTW